MNRQALAADSATKKLLIEFLLQMNDLARSNCTVVVVAATNCDPGLLDPAFVRRFEKKIFVPLPSPTERIEMMRANLHEIEHSIGDQDFQVLAKLTSGYRCGSISLFYFPLQLMMCIAAVRIFGLSFETQQ